MNDWETQLTEIDRRYQQRYDAQERAVAAALKAQERAVAAALAAVNKVEATTTTRFEGLDKTTVSQPQLKAIIERLDNRIDSVDRLTDAKFVTFRTLLDSEASRVKLALEASDKAVSKAETAAERRFESVNEFRAQLDDQARGFMSRTEAVALFTAQTARIDDMNRTLGNQMDQLRTDADQRRGTIEASRATYSYIIAAIGGLAGLVGMIVAIVTITNAGG